ncbi:MAG: pyridoxamine 5'-phosphate oxidase family protein [Clostridia bacterium]|nr:pyridoxamine 5'-phosphate oxidase family protein [Clostridia bacterium]
MPCWNEEAERIMTERFGKDTVIALATTADLVPYVRYVNAYYENGCFYTITYAHSNKMKHIEKNPVVAIAGDWFTAHGKGVSLGFFGREENAQIAEKLRKAFAAWIGNGHNDFEDKNTIILCVELTDGVLLSHGTRYAFQMMDGQPGTAESISDTHQAGKHGEEDVKRAQSLAVSTFVVRFERRAV